MDTVLNFDNHIIFKSASEVRSICSPLFKSFNTTYFNFVRRFEDGSEVCLTTDPDWTEHFYKNKLYKYVLADKFARTKLLVNKLKIIPWAQFSNSQVRIEQSKHFDVGIGISLIFRKQDHIDFFHYGTNNQNQKMTELYISYADCLIQFSYFFYDQGSKIISTASQTNNRLILPDRPLFRSHDDFPSIDDFNIHRFISESQPKRFHIYNNNGEVILTKKEIMCINFMTRGKTAKEIGDVLYMSKRTVETHLINAKQKLGLGTGTNRSDLIYALYKSGFDFNDLFLGQI